MAAFKRVLLAVSIAIVLALFVGYGINSFYHPPRYENFCNETQYYPEPVKLYQGTGQLLVAENCTTICKQMYPPKELQQSCTSSVGYIKENHDDLGCITSFRCETCQVEFDKVDEHYNRNVFIITSIVGLLALIVGGVLLSVEGVSAGIMGGGILTIIYGTIRFWTNLPDYGRFTILGIVLAVLIWVGYKKIKK